MFDLWSLIIGLVIGGSLGVAAVALLHGGGQPDDELWIKRQNDEHEQSEQKPNRGWYWKAALFALGFAVTYLLTACAPPQFVLGDVVPAPGGCIEARQRGHQC